MEVTYGPLVNPSDSFDSVASSLWLDLKWNHWKRQSTVKPAEGPVRAP